MGIMHTVIKINKFLTFLHAFYATFSTDSKSYFWEKNFNHTVKALFTNNEGNTDETAEKTENFL